MPNKDGTGPNGDYVNCIPNYDSPYKGRGQGRGFGKGRNRGSDEESMYNPRGLLRPRFQEYAKMTPEEEKTFLEKQKETIEQRIEKLENPKKE